MRRLAILFSCVLFASLLPVPAPASADVFGPIELASASAPSEGLHEQADKAQYPAISGDGRYVAFVGSFAGVEGIWRRDLLTGAVQQVAGGDATMPSISANGQYVSFTTTEPLEPKEDRNKAPDVYVRDMEVPCRVEGRSCQPCTEQEEARAEEGHEPSPCPFTIVSAVNATDEGATYTYSGANRFHAGEEEALYGSLASGRSAMSAEGRYVVFVTTAESNILNGPTPPLQVFVRDLDTKETKLVSAEYEPKAGRPADGEEVPVPAETFGEQQYGAVYPGGNETPTFGTAWAGASISADGSTVAWMGQEIGRQAELLPGEQGEQPEKDPELAEPLWRRISEGPNAPTRRITGGSDPANPLCAASGEQTFTPSPLDACAGPFEFYLENPLLGLWDSTKEDFVPQLSANGLTVAFLTGARELASGERQFRDAESNVDLYAVDMASGLTRVQALRRLTEIDGGGEGGAEELAKAAPIVDLAVSPDASQIAFVTQRTIFPLGSPAYVSPPAAEPGMLELFDVDLADDTLTRVTHGFEGEDQRSEQLHTPSLPGNDPYDSEDGAFSPSFSEDGETLSFSSTADNVVYGDGNDAPDAFVVHRETFPPAVVSQYVSSPPANPSLDPAWRVGVRAISRADGSVLLYAEVPGAGTVGASASGRVLVQGRAAASRRSAHGSRRRKGTATLATRQLASTKAIVAASSEGLVALTLTLAPAYRSLASRSGGLSATVTVTFRAPGHSIVHVSIPVTFVRTARAKTSKRSKASTGRASTGRASADRARANGRRSR